MAATNSTISYPIEIFLRVVGVWPESSYLVLRRIVSFIFVGLFILFEYWYIFASVKTADLPALLDAMSVTLSNTVVFIKLIIIWYNYRMFFNILAIMFDDWKSYALISQLKQLMMDKINLSSRISNYLVVMYGIGVISYFVTVLLTPEDTDEQLPTNNRKLLLKMEFPFDVMVTPAYEICITLQILVQNFISFCSAMIMISLAALVLHVGGQINIICQKLTDFSMNEEKYTRRDLRNLIIQHQRIVYLSNQIKHVFSYITLVQFLANILELCFLGYINVTALRTEDGISTLTKCLPFYVVVVFEAFTLCYTGEYLTLKGNYINQVAYNAVWYKLRLRESRSYLIFLMGSQKPLSLTAGKVVDLTLETFASMLKASASYISVLFAMF